MVIIEEYNENLFMYGDSEKLERVFVNLLNNAYQSFEGCGLIDICTFKSPNNEAVIRMKITAVVYRNTLIISLNLLSLIKNMELNRLSYC